MEIKLLNCKYIILKNEREALDEEVLKDLFTDYFEDFDYILGDWSYGKLRLKGFNDQDNPNYKAINDINTVEEYLENYCAFGCRHFLLKKVKEID